MALLLITGLTAPPATARSAADLTAAQLVTRAQRFASAARSLQVETKERDELRQRPGARAEKANIDYQLQVLPVARRVHMYVSGPGGAAEIIVADNGVYTRQAKTRDGLAVQRWDAVTLDQFRQQSGSNSVLAQPENATSILKTLSNPAVLSRGKRSTVLAVQLRSPALTRNLKAIHARLTIANSTGAPEHLQVDGLGYDPRLTVHLSTDYKDWNRELNIDVPGQPGPTGGQINPDEIAGYHATALYQPVAIPKGWVLATAKAVPAVPGNTTCDGIEVDYAASDGTAANVQVYEVPANCAPEPPGSTAQKFGPNSGFVGHDPVSNVNGARLTVGGSGLVVYTTLPTKDLVTMLSSLEPLDLNRPPTDTLGGAQAVN